MFEKTEESISETKETVFETEGSTQKRHGKLS